MPSRRNRLAGASPKSLFPEISSTSDGPWRSCESFYKFISRHSDPIAVEARRRMDSWFSEYPAQQRPELQARINGDEVAFYLVYFELLFHHFLIRQGYDVQAHPNLEFPTRPDFLATSKSGDAPFIMEVATATAAFPGVERGKKLTRDVMSTIRNLKHQCWSLVLQIEGAPRTTISKNKLVSAIQSYLKRLDDQFDRETETKDLPPLVWEHDGITLKFFPFHKQMNEDPRLISEPPNRMFVPVRPDNLIEKTVNRKLPSRYGEVSKSYLIAIGLASVNPDHIDVVGLEQNSTCKKFMAVG